MLSAIYKPFMLSVTMLNVYAEYRGATATITGAKSFVVEVQEQGSIS
jgi:hypothetical protein